MPYQETILYSHLPGLLATAAAHTRHLDVQVPLVVTTGRLVRDASPTAVQHGIVIGQSILQARRFCPTLLAVPQESVDAEAWSERLWNTLAHLSPIVEPAAEDAAYARVPHAEVARSVALLNERFPQLSARVGSGPSKLVARATTLNEVPFAHCPVTCLWEQDAAIAAALLRLGIDTVESVVALGESALRYRLGPKIGTHLYRRALGFDDDPIQPLWPLPHVVRSRRFDLEPIEDWICLEANLKELAHQASAEMGALGRYARRVQLTMQTQHHMRQLSWRPPWPVQSPSEIWIAARRLLSRMSPDAPVTALRLHALDLSLPMAETLSLLDEIDAPSLQRLEAARELLITRYGHAALQVASRLPLSLREKRREKAREAGLLP